MCTAEFPRLNACLTDYLREIVCQCPNCASKALIRADSELTPEALGVLRRLEPAVHRVVVSDRTWTDELAKWIEKLPKASSLSFANCDGLNYRFSELLQQREGLRRLELRGCDLSNVTFPTDSSLQALVLDNSNVADHQIKPVATYQDLLQFSANKTALTDTGLVDLLDLPLRHISLIETPASEELVEQLLEIDSAVLIELSVKQFAYDAFFEHPLNRRATGGSRINIYNKNWLKGR